MDFFENIKEALKACQNPGKYYNLFSLKSKYTQFCSFNFNQVTL